ncbi:MAG TPA: tRNA (adenosine(37)-N6)-dimethylallyltransferase MiaA [Rhizomicrobium sp.]
MKFDAVLIAGPTASGKSAAALALAEHIGGAIINADSMQVYRQTRILSARPSDEAMARAPHLLYGHVDMAEAYSVGRYQVDAAKAFEQARAQKRVPIFTGGTGLYFGALTEGLADIPPTPPAIRAEARAKLEAIGVEALHSELAARDPETARGLRPSDPQRVLRAYEVFMATGRPLASWQREAGKPALENLRLAKFVLDVPRDELIARIETRFRTMLAAGAMEEALMLQALDPALPAAKMLGAASLQALHAGTMNKEEAIAAAVIATRQYAKRQRTWFRGRMTDWNWISQSQRNIISIINDI